ncbi:bacillithiol system redox-active protein YtxJ [Sphingobacterium sp. SGG-5]|uniref:bacillithiol system redox-active protein YtxJ n=1 Tax=Sphingobacterium sp. SGG-5 TaxID=2710881 RepID=UPI0013EBDDC5|nr:bacillithiol system redox-active protein YtxJ [Sphingobacterium sp. SGG-5]NGM62350.1 bacillithiol system redox-active protein YtxJ [Sphingobacterium sp. SGG-5]
MNWIDLNSSAQLDAIWESAEIAVIFKHSTRCPVSGMAKRSLEFESDRIPSHIPFYYLDLLQHRDLSNKITEKWQVVHESPQVLVIQGNQCLYHASHDRVDMMAITPFLS